MYYIANLVLEQQETLDKFKARKNKYEFFELMLNDSQNTIKLNVEELYEKAFNVSISDLLLCSEDFQSVVDKIPAKECRNKEIENTTSKVHQTINYAEINKEMEESATGEIRHVEIVPLVSSPKQISVGGQGRHIVHSTESDSIKEEDGFRAESMVYYSLLKKTEGVSDVEWGSGYAEKAGVQIQGDDSLGYDIRYTDKNGQIHYVEVKSSTKTGNVKITLTKNEFCFGQAHKTSYEIWFVMIKDNIPQDIIELGNIFMFKEGEDFFNNSKFSVEQSEYKLRAKIIDK